MEHFYFHSANAKEAFPVFGVCQAGETEPDPHYIMSRTCSDIYVIEYVLAGEGVVTVDGSTYKVCAGDAYLLPAGHRHHYYASRKDPFHKIWMNVTGTLCRRLTEAYGIHGTVHFPATDISPLLTEFFHICRHAANDRQVHEAGALIFHRIMQQLVAKQTAAPDAAAVAKTYIDSNIDSRLTVKEVAAVTALSVAQLGRIFRRAYGETVYAYILTRKLETAEELLRNTTLSVCEISDMLSFADEHYFSSVFRKKRGLSPLSYRKNTRVF